MHGTTVKILTQVVFVAQLSSNECNSVWVTTNCPFISPILEPSDGSSMTGETNA